MKNGTPWASSSVQSSGQLPPLSSQNFSNGGGTTTTAAGQNSAPGLGSHNISISHSLEILLKVAERFGVPVMVLAVFLFLTREAAIAIHGTIIEPVVASHQKFIDVVSEQTKAQTDAMHEQAAAFSKLADSHDDQLMLLREALGKGHSDDQLPN